MSSIRPAVRFSLAVLLVLFISACRSPQGAAIKELEKLGVEVSGQSLLSSVESGNGHAVHLLLQARVLSGPRDSAGNTPLHIAIDRGHLTVARELVENGTDLSAANAAGVTPVSLAVFKGEMEIADRLLLAGAAPEGLMPDGDKVLPWAIRHGRRDFVRRLFEGGADPKQKDSAENPLLHVALESGHRELVPELLKLGADAAAVNGAGESSLVAALRGDGRDLIALLIAAGADPNHADSSGRVAFQFAIDACDPGLAKHLSDLGARPDGGSWSAGLWKAINERDLAACRLYLGLGVSPETPAPSGRRPLEFALANDLPDFLHLFLCYGADGDSLFDEACHRKLDHHISLLLAHGCRPPPLPAPFLDTRLGLAIRQNDFRVAKLLLDCGVSPVGVVAEGEPPLHLAIVLGRPRMVQLLLAHGVDPNVPLGPQVSDQFLRLVHGGTLRWLLRNDRNITPILLAADSGNPETARLLMAAGARTETWARRTRIWPVNIAARKEDVKMMRMLLGKNPSIEPRRIIVDLSDQLATLLDSAGGVVFKTKVSTGKKGFVTPTGTFVITNKYRNWTSNLYEASMPCFQRLSCGDFGFHQGNVPGYPASHGCIRVPAGHAQKLFALTEIGDRVEIRP